MKDFHTLLLPFTFYLLPAALLLSCSDDDTSVPSLTYDFIEAVVGADSCVSHIVNDRGDSFTIDRHIRTTTADSTLRCVASYTVSPDSTTATVYGIEHIYSKHPVPAADIEESSKAPVKLQSWWQSGGYINMIIGVLTTGQGSHKFAFSEDYLTTEADGLTTVHISLLHKHPDGDAESYTEKVYMSIPLDRYKGNYSNVSLNINTYEGERTKTFTINNN